MRRFLAATAAASVLLATPAPSLAEECLDKKLSGAALERCFYEAASQKPVTSSKTDQNTADIKFPIRITSNWNTYQIKQHDPQKRKLGEFVEIASEDGKDLTIVTGSLGHWKWDGFKPNKSLIITAANIAGWTLSDQTYADSSGIGTLVPAAIVFPPMLLLTPFASRLVTTSYVVIVYLDEFGTKQSVQLTTDSLQAIQETTRLIQAVSGLNAGDQKTEKQLSAAYNTIEKELAKKVLSLKQSLVIPNKSKPWCEKIDSTSLPLVYAKYRELNDRLSLVRTSLGLPVDRFTNVSNEEAKWAHWLSDNSNTATWAKGNPKAAEKLRKCDVEI